MANKMSATGQFELVGPYGHSNLVIFNQISSQFHKWITFIKLSPKLKYGFCPTKDNQTKCQFACVDTQT